MPGLGSIPAGGGGCVQEESVQAAKTPSLQPCLFLSLTQQLCRDQTERADLLQASVSPVSIAAPQMDPAPSRKL
ncbi:hypothetical protein H920_05658 [Fukomys damarensis]|uniref:Uncharacterized protein n=1 Tax=Fukomys damarensis TaxID=885580 RepID=A0A091DPN0_FUKDA|nr:hypothetical protein H920_05658 [Fukomys damarensis]